MKDIAHYLFLILTHPSYDFNHATPMNKVLPHFQSHLCMEDNLTNYKEIYFADMTYKKEWPTQE